MITTTIIENNKYLMRKSDIYYIPEADAGIFTRRAPQASLCPTDPNPTITATSTDGRVIEDAKRYRMIAGNMQRINPDWRSPDSD